MKPAIYVSITSTTVSLILAVLMTQSTSWHIIAVTLIFNTLGWLYSAPPVRLHSRRLGEMTIAVGTGFCVPAVGYILAMKGLTNVFTPFMIPLVLYGFVLSLCLQIPDFEVDKNMGKNTIVGLMGRKQIYRLVLATTLIASVMTHLFLNMTGGLIWLRWATLIPLATALAGVTRTDSRVDASKYTMFSISSLFVYLVVIDLVLMYNSGLF
jgi:1,4-dihydroxy-2-naphthoate octaprenyltransferase